MNTTAVRFFDKHIMGRNIMTPDRVDVGWTADGQAWELCGGTDFDRHPMWGVTVLDDDASYATGEDKAIIDSHRSELFNVGTTEQRWVAATDYVAQLRGQQDGTGYRQNIERSYAKQIGLYE